MFGACACATELIRASNNAHPTQNTNTKANEARSFFMSLSLKSEESEAVRLTVGEGTTAPNSILGTGDLIQH
jgi:hypothetical protein